ncbi:hemolysin III family protein [Streptomyces sp. WMMB303]|uniref:PAQR family membrane homeostasis protein TrhA n=1 Tax=Streptomyces sp. WMMB303 TaxID=3034154 RepID=UPI0023EAB96D|nr:hemolysin III family protein [Streptomyces sp. WMMB303]MDF4253733.1 hemolysin III family protein [Streptomyces sp. WMMB303]
MTDSASPSPEPAAVISPSPGASSSPEAPSAAPSSSSSSSSSAPSAASSSAHFSAAKLSASAHSAAQVIKPKLRGWLHLGMFPAVLISGMFLTALADSMRGRVACAVYTLSACLLFGVSALYHRGDWSPRVNAVLRRLDHANIFLIIAGTYTPLTILLLPDGRRDLLLWGIWIAAGLGIAFRVFWVGAPRWLYTPCYIAMGWAAVFFLPEFMRQGGIAVMVCVIVGGLLYSAGGIIYGIKRPNPSPRWFGFHEVFHSFTLAAFVVHYVGISLVAYQHA